MLVSDPVIKEQKMLKVMRLIRLLHVMPYSAKELAKRIETSNRSIYRYLHLINACGVEVKEFYEPNALNQGTPKYYLDSCPCCGKNVDKNVNGNLEKS